MELNFQVFIHNIVAHFLFYTALSCELLDRLGNVSDKQCNEDLLLVYFKLYNAAIYLRQECFAKANIKRESFFLST